MDAYAKSKTPKEVRDDRGTPTPVFERIQEIMGMPFVLDVCATPQNSKCNLGLSPNQDALTLDWKDWMVDIGMCFMNPPYSNPYVWCAKAWHEAQKGIIVVGLLPDDRSTHWYQHWIEGKATVCYVPDKRISFINPVTGKPQGGNPKGSVFPVWTPWQTGRTQYVRFEL